MNARPARQGCAGRTSQTSAASRFKLWQESSGNSARRARGSANYEHATSAVRKSANQREQGSLGLVLLGAADPTVPRHVRKREVLFCAAQMAIHAAWRAADQRISFLTFVYASSAFCCLAHQ